MSLIRASDFKLSFGTCDLIHHPDSPKNVGLDLTPFPGYLSDEEPAASSGTHSPTPTGMGISEPSPASVLLNFLVVPEAPTKLKRNPSGVAQVLTSKEIMELLEAKEKKKRKEEREHKAREREQQKREKERIQQDKKKKTACGQTQENSMWANPRKQHVGKPKPTAHKHSQK